MSTAGLSIEPEWRSADRAVLHLKGEFGIESARDVRAALALLETPGPATLALDLREVELLDSSGLRVIVEADRRAREAGRHFFVTAPRGTVTRRLLEMTLLTDLVSVDEGDASGGS